MQTTHTDKASGKGLAAQFSGTPAIKSLADLGTAVLDRDIDRFAEQYRKGADCWREAGKILVAMTEKHPEAMKRIQERTGLEMSVLQTFARIGRNEIWPPLIVDSSIGARKLLECHYEDQKKYSQEPIEVAVEWKMGKIKTVKRKVSELSRAECAVVFGGDGKINTLDQQAFRLRTGAAEKKPIQLEPKDPAPEYAKPRMVNVDIGYFSIVIQPDGEIKCEPCGKSPVAQPVRVISNGKGYKSAVVVLYKQETR